MRKSFMKNALGWGFILWLVGYVLGFLFFSFLPPAAIGWAIMPIGIAITIWVAFAKVHGEGLSYYAALGAAWAVMAVILDYCFIVKLLNPADGYYKLDVYLYYALTFAIPLAVGARKLTQHP